MSKADLLSIEAERSKFSCVLGDYTSQFRWTRGSIEAERSEFSCVLGVFSSVSMDEGEGFKSQ